MCNTVLETNPGQTGPAMVKVTGDQCATPTTYICIDQNGWTTGGGTITASVATGPVSLSPGDTAIIYFKINNGTLTTLDSGVSTTVSVFAGKAGGPQSITVAGKSQ